MDLEKLVVIDKIEVLEFGHIQVRQATKIMEDGKEISKTYHRHVLNPGDSLEGQNQRVVAVASAVWTDDVLKTYRDMVKKQKLN